MKYGKLAFIGLLSVVISPIACVSAPSFSDSELGGEGGGGLCKRDSDCSDGNFCNGEEICDPGSKDAGPSGCVEARAVPSCDDGIACTQDSCSTTTNACQFLAPDEDGDGREDADCKDLEGQPVGDDCDDGDPERFPGNTEVCDSADRDEDCDPQTVGFKDEDGDGAISDECCNEDNCGDDCNDNSIAQRPLQPEFCDKIDNNCDGKVDNDTQKVPWYEDEDQDGFGVLSKDIVESCDIQPGRSLLATDCNDDSVSVHPARDEKCEDAIDNNCNGYVDEGVDCEQPLGERVCEENLTWCATDCVNLQTDESSCGTCFEACDSDEVCSSGKCKNEEPSGAGGGSGSGGSSSDGGSSTDSGGSPSDGGSASGGAATGGTTGVGGSGSGGELIGQTGPPPPRVEGILRWDFETPSGFSTSGQWEIGAVSGSAPQPLTGSLVAGTNLDGSYESEPSRLTTPWFTVPAANSFPYLRYQYWYDLTGNDFAHIQIRTDASGPWLNFDELTGSLTYLQGKNPRWQQGMLPLELFGGQEIQISFLVEPGNQSSPAGKGLFVDKVELWSGIMDICSCQGFNGDIYTPYDWAIEGGQFGLGTANYAVASGNPPAPYNGSAGLAGASLGGPYASLARAPFARLVSPTHHVNNTTMRAEFQHWRSLTAGTSVRVQIRHVPGHWEDLPDLEFTGKDQAWKPVVIQLADWENLTIQIGFLLSNGGGSVSVVDAGYFVDEFNFLTN